MGGSRTSSLDWALRGPLEGSLENPGGLGEIVLATRHGRLIVPACRLVTNSESSREGNLLYLEWAKVLFLKAQLLPFSIFKCRMSSMTWPPSVISHRFSG